MRASDQIRAVRSYIVFREKNGELIVKGSHWAPGYTPAHCETKEEALDYKITQLQRKKDQVSAEIAELYDYKATMLSEDR